jgi:hypothetical protein
VGISENLFPGTALLFKNYGSDRIQWLPQSHLFSPRVPWDAAKKFHCLSKSQKGKPFRRYFMFYYWAFFAVEGTLGGQKELKELFYN